MAKEEAEKKAKAKVKTPTALKRHHQSVKRREHNRAAKSEIRTTIKKFRESVAKGQKEEVNKLLPEIYSIVDKAVKKGILKLNKGSRTKSRLTALALR